MADVVFVGGSFVKVGGLFMDWETGSKIGRGGQAVIPYGHLVEIAALVE